MKISNVKLKVYYRFFDLLLHRNQIILHESMQNKKNIFLYFDYEREFGGHNTRISDNEVFLVLKELEKYDFNTTWFTVGKIFSHYPESIKAILNYGHEIGSHSFNHIKPYDVSQKTINKDFQLFHKQGRAFTNIEGFHSPEGKWSKTLVNALHTYGYKYDVIAKRKDKACRIIKMKKEEHSLFYRFETVGDDWDLYKTDYTPNEHLNYFIGLEKKISINEFGGIGFHPWILFSNENIFEGFKLFLKYLHNHKQLNVISIPQVIQTIDKE